MSTKVIHEGWMVRYGRKYIFGSFIHMRYFVLEARLLAYYERKPQNDEAPIKSLSINENCRVEDRGLRTHQGHMVYVLYVYDRREKDKGIMMGAFNILEALLWKEKIEVVIDQFYDEVVNGRIKLVDQVTYFDANDNTETTIEDYETSSDDSDTETRGARNETNTSASESPKIEQGGSGVVHKAVAALGEFATPAASDPVVFITPPSSPLPSTPPSPSSSPLPSLPLFAAINDCLLYLRNKLMKGHLDNTKETREETYGATSRWRSSNPSEETWSLQVFSYLDIEGATNSLNESSKIGQGGYGSVYKGFLNNKEVAIKMLDARSKQGLEEFIQELEVLGQMHHPNLVSLIGACFKLRALVYEFLPNGSVEDCLKKSPRLLTWRMRTCIVHEICSTLVFLHSNKPRPLVHGDLKPHNILLDAHFKSKLADFGLCRFLPEGTLSTAFLDTKPKGTLEYIDPVFLRTGILTPFSDMYSFGVTILRLLTGMEPLGIATKVRAAYKDKSVMTMVDHTAGNWPTDVAEFLAYFGLRCCNKKKDSQLLKEILEDLEIILDAIDN